MDARFLHLDELIDKALTTNYNKYPHCNKVQLFRGTKTDLPPDVATREILIDGDSRLFRCSYDGETKELITDTDIVFNRFNESIEYIKTRVASHELGYHKFLKLSKLEQQQLINGIKVVVFLGSKSNFRTEIYSRYKLNRTIARDDELVKSSADMVGKYRQMIAERFTGGEVVVLDGLEADDCIGLCKAYSKYRDITWSVDKDMRTLEGYTAYDERGKLDVVYVTKHEAEINRFIQYMVGDPVDGYGGVPGISTKEVNAYIDVLYGDDRSYTEEETVYIVTKIYQHHMGKSVEDYARKIMSVATILQPSNINSGHVNTIAGHAVAF